MRVTIQPIGSLKDNEDLNTLIMNLLAIEQAFDKRLDEQNYADGSVGTATIEDGAVTPAKTSGGVARISNGRYVGDGAANREIDLGYKPKKVMIIRNDDSKIFESIDDTLNIVSWWRDSAGAVGAGSTVWQGITNVGFKLGSSAANAANASGIAYSYVAHA